MVWIINQFEMRNPHLTFEKDKQGYVSRRTRRAFKRFRDKVAKLILSQKDAISVNSNLIYEMLDRSEMKHGHTAPEV